MKVLKFGGSSVGTAERIRRIAEQYGYRVSAVSRSLATSKTETVGVVVTSISDPFVAGVVEGIENEVCNDDLVTDDYYKQGLAVNQTLQRDHGKQLGSGGGRHALGAKHAPVHSRQGRCRGAAGPGAQTGPPDARRAGSNGRAGCRRSGLLQWKTGWRSGRALACVD